jgi:four helix bundle protein
MATITRFEEIQAWQEGRALTKQIYRLTSEGAFARDFGLRDQIQRATISITANIAEGFDCDSNTEFGRFLGYARRSAVEVQSLLYAAYDLGYLDETSFRECFDQATKTKALIGGFIHFLKKSQKRTAQSG